MGNYQDCFCHCPVAGDPDRVIVRRADLHSVSDPDRGWDRITALQGKIKQERERGKLLL